MLSGGSRLLTCIRMSFKNMYFFSAAVLNTLSEEQVGSTMPSMYSDVGEFSKQ